jgi:hypothetical protein
MSKKNKKASPEQNSSYFTYSKRAVLVFLVPAWPEKRTGCIYTRNRERAAELMAK